MLRGFFYNPVWILGNFCVDTRLPGASTPFAPAGDAHQVPNLLVLAWQGPSWIPLCHRRKRQSTQGTAHVSISLSKKAWIKSSIMQCQHQHNCLDFNDFHLRLVNRILKQVFCFSSKLSSKYFPVIAKNFHFALRFKTTMFCFHRLFCFVNLSTHTDLKSSEDYMWWWEK